MEPESTIPWEERALFAIATWQNGLAFRSSHFSERGQPVIKIAELKNGITGQTRYTEQEFDAQMRVSAGDVLFAWSGSPDTSIDTFRWMGPDGWLNQHIFKVTSGPDVDQDFLFGLLRALRPTFVKIARDKQTTGLGHVTLDDLRRLRIHLPPYEEQRRIAGVLGALDNKIEHNERLGARARDVADSRFRESFLGSTRNDRRPLGEVVAVHRESVAPAEQPDLSFEHFSIPAFDTGRRPTLQPGAAILSGKTRLPKTDAILFSKLNPTTPRVWWPRPTGAGEAVCSGEFLVLVPTGVPASFLYASLRNDATLYEEILSHATGTTGSRQRVKASEVLASSVANATPEQLESYKSFARPLYDLDAALLRESADLAAVRDALLPKLVSGQIRVPESYDPDDVLGMVAEEAAAS